MDQRDRKMPIDAALIARRLTNQDNANAVAAFEHEEMANVANFSHMTDKDIIEMCKTMNGQALNQNGHQIGASKAKHVRALTHWA